MSIEDISEGKVLAEMAMISCHLKWLNEDFHVLKTLNTYLHSLIDDEDEFQNKYDVNPKYVSKFITDASVAIKELNKVDQASVDTTTHVDYKSRYLSTITNMRNIYSTHLILTKYNMISLNSINLDNTIANVWNAIARMIVVVTSGFYGIGKLIDCYSVSDHWSRKQIIR